MGNNKSGSRFQKHSVMSKRNSKRRKKIRERIAERDGWICWWCREPVDPAGIGKEAPSLDHVVSLAEGGSNRRTNLRLAHVGCNNERHD